MLDKIKNYTKSPSFKQLQDVRVIGLLVFGAIAFLVSWSTISAIQTNYGLQKQISAVQQENAVLELENRNQNLSNQYYNSNQFLELAARRQFGKGAANEKLIIVPKGVAVSYTVEPSKENKKAVADSVRASVFQRNFQAWMDFFQHRQTDS